MSYPPRQGYPPPDQGYPPPPMGGYPPPQYAPQYAAPPPPPPQEQKKQVGCLEGCLAALCFCCIVDACFDCF